jgi:NAD(P)-dependent dehydrogenase (short-subunit alcohol dehydrogenase family)
MDKKIALVSGANKSMGFEVVRGLAKLGMIVYLGSRDEKRGVQAANELKDEGDVRYIKLNVADEQTMVDAIKKIEQEQGHLDVLVNNAGIAAVPSQSQEDLAHIDYEKLTASGCNLDDTRSMFETNVFGAARLTQLAVPLLRKSQSARVVNTGSGAGSLSNIVDNNSSLSKVVNIKPFSYGLSKVALNGVTALFAADLRRYGIKVNSANPGLVSSELSHFMGTRTAKDGARIIIKLATLDDDGPTGGFFSEDGPTAW